MLETFAGYDPNASGEPMTKLDSIDRENRLRREVIFDDESGVMIQNDCEPLFKHTGRGSDKFRKKNKQ